LGQEPEIIRCILLGPYGVGIADVVGEIAQGSAHVEQIATTRADPRRIGKYQPELQYQGAKHIMDGP
jgi:hypothetical protein